MLVLVIGLAQIVGERDFIHLHGNFTSVLNCEIPFTYNSRNFIDFT